jgi:predicted nucleic acid-binding protein
VIRAVLDTNTFVSGVIAPKGIPNQVLEAAGSGDFLLIASPFLVGEVVTV